MKEFTIENSAEETTEKNHEVHFHIRGSITIPSNTVSIARERLLSSDYTESSQLLKALEQSLEECGNGAITIDDIIEG